MANRREGITGEGFFAAAVRSLAIDVRYDAAALAALPATGPLVVVANHPYGVLDGIVISWLIQKVRPDFLVLTNAVLLRAPEIADYVLPIDFAATEEATRTNIASRAAARAPPRCGRLRRGLPGGRHLDRARPARPPARHRRALAALHGATDPALARHRGADLLRGAEQPPVPDRQPPQPGAAAVAHLPRGADPDRHRHAGGDRPADRLSRTCRTGRTDRRWPTTSRR